MVLNRKRRVHDAGPDPALLTEEKDGGVYGIIIKEK